MVGARRVADRYRNDPDLRRLCQTVVPVAGLTAQAAVTLKQFEFAQFRSLAVADRDALDDVLLSANRFLAADPTITGDLTPEVRRQLLDRFGLWGVRISVALVRAGVAPSAPRLADELVERSGLAELRRVLADQLGTRAEALKARTALILLRRTVIANPIDGGETIRAEVERTLASAHVLEELRLLPALRAGTSGLRGDLVPLAERLLGGGGSSMEVRLGLDQTTDAPAASSAAAVASAEVERWQSVAAHPLTSPAGRHAAQVLSRTAEGLALAVTAETGRSAHPNQQETTITQ
jgi:hypothetical protein